MEHIEEVVGQFSGTHRHIRKKFKNKLRVFLRWCLYNKITDKDLSLLVGKEKSVTDPKLPSTFSAEECKLILKAVERASPAGKRDYAILLCIAVYGWRAADIRELRLENIDWRKNKISFIQQKTSVPVEFPIIPAVGNAIIDYLKNARPESDSNHVVLMMSHLFMGLPIKGTSFIYRLLLRYVQLAGIKGLDKRKHGSHAFRFSLATHLIASGHTISLTKSILGHKTTDVTLNYVRLDISSLKKCNLPVPACVSPLYESEGL